MSKIRDRAADIQARLTAAGGPWRLWDSYKTERTDNVYAVARIGPEGGGGLVGTEGRDILSSKEALAFVAQAPEDIGWLLEERDRAVKDVDRLRAALEEIQREAGGDWRSRMDRQTTITRPAPMCEACGSSNVYVLADNTVVCRRCGHRSEGK